MGRRGKWRCSGVGPGPNSLESPVDALGPNPNGSASASSEGYLRRPWMVGPTAASRAQRRRRRVNSVKGIVHSSTHTLLRIGPDGCLRAPHRASGAPLPQNAAAGRTAPLIEVATIGERRCRLTAGLRRHIRQQPRRPPRQTPPETGDGSLAYEVSNRVKERDTPALGRVPRPQSRGGRSLIHRRRAPATNRERFPCRK
jgi:hypothetical protein